MQNEKDKQGEKVDIQFEQGVVVGRLLENLSSIAYIGEIPCPDGGRPSDDYRGYGMMKLCWELDVYECSSVLAEEPGDSHGMYLLHKQVGFQSWVAWILVYESEPPYWEAPPHWGEDGEKQVYDTFVKMATKTKVRPWRYE